MTGVQCAACGSAKNGAGVRRWIELPCAAGGRGRLLASSALVLRLIRDHTETAIELSGRDDTTAMWVHGTLEQHSRVASAMRIAVAGGTIEAITGDLERSAVIPLGLSLTRWGGSR